MAVKKNKKSRVRHPLSLKLNVIISTLMLLSLVVITVFTSLNLSKSEEVNARQNLLQINSTISNIIESQLKAVKDNSELVLKQSESLKDKTLLTDKFFNTHSNIIAINVPTYGTFLNKKYFTDRKLNWQKIQSFINSQATIQTKALTGKNSLINAWTAFDDEVLAMFTLCRVNGIEKNLNIFFKFDENTYSQNSLVYDTFMVNSSGQLLTDNDVQLIKKNTNYKKNIELEEGFKSITQIGQYAFPNPTVVKDNHGRIISGETSLHKIINIYNAYPFVKNKLPSFDYKFISFHKIPLTNTIVFTSVPKSKIFEGIYITTGQNILITLVIMFITIIFIYFFSKTLSHPILRLKKASEDIEKGNFNIALKPRGHDEITVLTQSMNKMAEGLGQKERLKKMFERFTNKAVAQKALTGELKLGGETKTATVFFSDIRGFTAMSESMSPEEVISFLNDYMTRMVACVVKTGGIVDKFIGDSVMAVWGAPFTSGNPAEDALNAVKAALLMRSSLIVFNKERALLNQSPVKIGCGINTGSVVAGQMGSQKHKIEYTVLGDTVNFASRTEALNKPLGTDILITENTYNLIKEHLIAEEMPAVSVKGKTGLCRMFAVINIKDCTDIPGAGKNGPKTLSQIRQKLGIKEPDFSKININEEEHKYKIQGQ